MLKIFVTEIDLYLKKLRNSATNSTTTNTQYCENRKI